MNGRGGGVNSSQIEKNGYSRVKLKKTLETNKVSLFFSDRDFNLLQKYLRIAPPPQKQCYCDAAPHGLLNMSLTL